MWKFIQKLLSNGKQSKKTIPDHKNEMTFKDFLKQDVVQQTLAKLQRQTITLNPRSVTISGNEKSKMGGEPNLVHFSAYPMCDSCNSPLNFVLQIEKVEFPEFYWPINKNFFQLFRCPNYDCGGAFSEQYDLKMFHFYFTHHDEQQKIISKPDVEISNREDEVNACLFHRESMTDYPMFDTSKYEDYETIELTYSDALLEEFEERFHPQQRTKIMGYPSFTQNTFYPTCTCGKEKEFFFQLASEDKDQTISEKDFQDNDYWSHHGIMIGDVGNIYYFVCKDCGEQSIESYWDCS